MPELDVTDVPVTVVTGFLGVGKTTAILDLFGHRPPDGRWAVLVNEFGEIGIDGAILAEGGLIVEEVPGGCICCSAGLALRVALVRLLREVRPDRLLIEPTGLAHPAAVIDTLRTPGLGQAVDVRAVIGVVDPRHCRSARHRASEVWQDQIRLADVLVANKTDLAAEADLAAFHAMARDAWPEKLVVAETAHGRMDPAWLDLGSRTEEVVHHDHQPGSEVAHWGTIWPPRVAFDRQGLEQMIQTLVRPGPILPHGVDRLKGVFRLRRGWFLIQADADAIRWSPIGHRRDSRVEVIVPRGPGGEAPDWSSVAAAFAGVRLR